MNMDDADDAVFACMNIKLILRVNIVRVYEFENADSVRITYRGGLF